jgi:hypothetical protein
VRGGASAPLNHKAGPKSSQHTPEQEARQMKQKDLVVGQDYAYRRSRTDYYGYGERVRVLETGLVRDIGRWRHNKRADGVKVVWISKDGEPSTAAYGTRTLMCSQIVSTWEDEQERRKERKAMLLRVEKESEKCEARMEAACKVLGFDHYSWQSTIALGVERLEQYGALLTAARAVVGDPDNIANIEALSKAVA